MSPETPHGDGHFLRLLRAREMCARRIFVSALRFYALAVLMLGIRPDCLRSEPRL